VTIALFNLWEAHSATRMKPFLHINLGTETICSNEK